MGYGTEKNWRTGTPLVSQQKGQRFRIQLRHLVVTLFSKEEFITICYDFGLQYDNLAGDILESKVRELITHLARNKQIIDLIDYCITKRPGARVSFEEIAETARTNPDIFLGVAIESTESKTEFSNTAVSGITVLAQLVNSPNVLENVIGFQKDFEVARSKIDIVNHYKLLHDHFQDLETSYELMVHDRERLAHDDSAWESLYINGLIVQDSIQEIIDIAANPDFTNQNGAWFNLLSRGQEMLQTAIEEKQLEQLDNALRYLYRAMDRGLPRVNGRLVDAAVDLPLDNLVSAMASILDNLRAQAEVDMSSLQQLADGVDALAELTDNLTELVINHNGWQGLSDELRRIEANMGNDVFEIELAWPDIRYMADQLYGQREERWATSLKRIELHLEQNLVAKTITTINAIFQSYRSQANRHFRNIDDELLRLCQNLQKIGAPLDLLLRTIQ